MARVEMTDLTEREQEVWRGIVAGATNREIGKSLIPPIETNTVRVHCRHIKKKVGDRYPKRSPGGYWKKFVSPASV